MKPEASKSDHLNIKKEQATDECAGNAFSMSERNRRLLKYQTRRLGDLFTSSMFVMYG